MATADEHVFYSKAPLRLATIEIRFTYQPRFNQREVRDRFAVQIEDDFPVLAEETVAAQIGSTSSADEVIQIRATNERRTTSVALGAHALSLIINNVDYVHFEQLCGLVVRMYDGVRGLAPTLRVQRIGLRFLNEVRLPVGSAESKEWRQWINPELLGALGALDASSEGVQGQVQFVPGPDSGLVLRYADLQGSSVVTADMPLKMPEVEVGEFFILDIDSWWHPESAVPLENAAFTENLLRLHDPLQRVFEWAITDNARSRFRGE